MNTTRQQKIEAMLQRELANIFLVDSRNIYKCMITVTNVKVTPDLSIARAYISVYNTADKELIIKLIKENTKDIRFRLSRCATSCGWCPPSSSSSTIPSIISNTLTNC